MNRLVVKAAPENHVPTGCRIIRTFLDPRLDTWFILVEGPRLPFCAPGCYPYQFGSFREYTEWLRLK